MGESAVKSQMRSAKYKNNAAISMKGKQLTHFFDSLTILANKRKQNDSGAGEKYSLKKCQMSLKSR